MMADELEQIRQFESPVEFARFEAWIASRIAEGALREIDVEQAYISGAFEERWFQSRSGRVWRLVSPEHPFQGLFGAVVNEA